jgi:hypothetical protein
VRASRQRDRRSPTHQRTLKGASSRARVRTIPSSPAFAEAFRGGLRTCSPARAAPLRGRTTGRADLLFARSRAAVPPACRGTGEETASRSQRSLSPDVSGRVPVRRAPAADELQSSAPVPNSPLFAGIRASLSSTDKTPAIEKQQPGADSDDAHRTAAHRAACVASRRVSRARPIGSTGPVVSDVILRITSETTGHRNPANAGAAGRTGRAVRPMRRPRLDRRGRGLPA